MKFTARAFGRVPPFAALCQLCVYAGLAPDAWVDMTAKEFLRALARRSAS